MVFPSFRVMLVPRSKLYNSFYLVTYLPNREPHERTPIPPPPNSATHVRKGQPLLINSTVPCAGA